MQQDKNQTVEKGLKWKESDIPQYFPDPAELPKAALLTLLISYFHISK